MGKEDLNLYRAKQREETEERIREAIDALQELGIKPTKAAIAKESGLAKATLTKACYSELIDQLCAGLPNSDSASTVKELQEQLAKQKLLLERSRIANRKLRDTIDKQEKDYDELYMQYQKLLGRYQIDVGKKIISF